jgi:hypothetical protein
MYPPYIHDTIGPYLYCYPIMRKKMRNEKKGYRVAPALDVCQGLDDRRDTMTAKAISTPHLHFSHNTWRSCPVHPCGVVVGLLVDAKLVFTTSLACDVVVVAGACTTGRLSHTCGCCVAVVDLEIEGENGLGLIGEVGVVVISGFPLSRSPIFGRSRRVSVQ